MKYAVNRVKISFSVSAIKLFRKFQFIEQLIRNYLWQMSAKGSNLWLTNRKSGNGVDSTFVG